MNDKKFIAESKVYQRKLKKFLRNYGRRCGHIGKDEISLDCIVCKSWLFYDLFAWFIENAEDSIKWAEKQGGKRKDENEV